MRVPVAAATSMCYQQLRLSSVVIESGMFVSGMYEHGRWLIDTSRTLILIAGFCLVAWTSIAIAAEFKGPVWGGSGGNHSYNLDCGSGGVMVGVSGKAGSWIDQLVVTCRSVAANGSLGSTYTRGPVGGTGGTGKSVICASGYVVGKMASSSGSYMNELSPMCYPWNASTRRPDYAMPKYPGVFGGWLFTLGINHNEPVMCPAEKVGKALRGKYGGYIDSLQFVCDQYNM